jgi:hypothetical protein
MKKAPAIFAEFQEGSRGPKEKHIHSYCSHFCWLRQEKRGELWLPYLGENES